MKNILDPIHFCQYCGCKYENNCLDLDNVAFRCEKCGLNFYLSSPIGTSAIIPNKNNPQEVLVNRRTIPPYTDMISLPGGFAKYGENPKDAVLREIVEEVGLTLEITKLVHFEMQKHTYQIEREILGMVFLCSPIDTLPTHLQASEVKSVEFFDVSNTQELEKQMPFTADIAGLNMYLNSLSK